MPVRIANIRPKYSSQLKKRLEDAGFLVQGITFESRQTAAIVRFQRGTAAADLVCHRKRVTLGGKLLRAQYCLPEASHNGAIGRRESLVCGEKESVDPAPKQLEGPGDFVPMLHLVGPVLMTIFAVFEWVCKAFGVLQDLSAMLLGRYFSSGFSPRWRCAPKISLQLPGGKDRASTEQAKVSKVPSPSRARSCTVLEAWSERQSWRIHVGTWTGPK